MNNVVKRAWNQNRLVKIEDLCGMTFQAESGGHTFEISGVDDSGNNVSFSGTVEGRFLRPDNAQINISGSISNGKASVTLTSACYAIPGRFLLTIYVTSGNQKVAVYSATGSVVATSGLATGSIPPLETDSLIAGTVTANSITTNNITANGVVDITPRRAYASLSSEGWYRILQYSGDNQYATLGTPSFIIRFGITRHASTTSGEAHEITMTAAYNGSVRFSNEISNSNALIIDKIRYTYNGNNAYVDIHYNNSGANIVNIDFDVDARLYIKQEIVSQPFTSVADSPSGETVLAEYEFAANTDAIGTITPRSGITISEIRVCQQGKVVQIHGVAQGSFTGGTTGYDIGTVSGVTMPPLALRCVGGCGSQPYYAENSAYILIDTYGAITARVTVNSSYITFNITYLLN